MYICEECFRQYDEQYDICPFCGKIKNSEKRAVYLLPVGTVLHGQYIIGKLLGSGGFANTYKAWDTKFNRYVVIKEAFLSGVVNRVPGTTEVILLDKNKSKEFRHGIQWILSEAEFISQFHAEANINHVYEFFEENNTAYSVMEFLEGVTLGEYLKKNGGIVDIVEAKRIILQVAHALEAIHQKGYIHLDVTPYNIVLKRTENGAEIILIIASGKLRQYKPRKYKIELPLILAPGYASPESYVRRIKQGPRSDIYSLGAVMYRMITGIEPEESINRKIEDTLPLPHTLNPFVSLELSEVIMKAMALNPQKRFQNIEKFKKAVIGEKSGLFKFARR